MIGKTISHYKIIEKLGDGGMGEVYLAEDIKLKRKVALKFLPKEFSRDSESKKRFINEARSASSLDHNNICIIHEISETDSGQLFISMNYCRGEPLQDYIQGKDLTLKEILRIVKQIAKGLEKAHSKGIIHCDIKPSNIIITDNKVAKIVDFGIAKIASDENLHSNQRTSGTIAYMSPEQVSDSDFDTRTDIWSLGVVFYEMLTKQMPFQDTYNEALMYSIINEEPIAVTNIYPDIPVQLDEIVFKMLKKNPEERYHSVNELLSDIKSYSRIVDIPINPIKYLKLFFADKKSKRLSLVASFLLSIFIFSIIYITVIQGSSVPSIGILYMENLGESEDDFWSRGITEDLIINVASAGVIRVPTLNEINTYDGLNFSIEELAKKLRVDYLLSSSLIKKDSTFDLWCRIIDQKTGKDVFARKWSKPIQEVSTITTILAGTVLNNLGISSKTTKEPIIVDPDAYELYLKGKHVFETRQTNDDIIISRGLLQQSLNIDQNFIQAKIQLGQSYTGTSDFNQALMIFEECLDYGKELKDENAVALAMFNIGNIQLYKYQFELATDNYEKALTIVRKNNDKYHESKILRNMGNIHYLQNDYTKAKEYYNESRLISALLKEDKLGETESLFNLGSIFLQEMDFKAAMTSFQELYDIFDNIKDKSKMGYALNGISLSHMGMGEIESALDFANASLKSAREISDKQNELNSLINLGEINYWIGNNEKAMKIFRQSIELTNDINDVYYSGISNQYLGLLMLRNNNYHEAMNYFEIADIDWKMLKDPTHGVWTNSAWALAAQRAGEFNVADREIFKTEFILEKNKPYKDYAMCVYYNLYNYYAEIGDTSLVKKYLSNANNEIIKRLKYIDNQKNKNDFLNKIVEYGEINNLYKKYFD